MQLTYNILIVDDVVDNIQIAMNMLKEENYNLTFALSGKEALSLIESNRFDMILLDIMMPDIDGFAVCERIKQMSGYRDVPVIFVTAKLDVDSIANGFKVGAVDYVTKPFQADELMARVRTHLELHQARLVLEEHNLSLQVKVEHERKRLIQEIEEGQKELIWILTEMMESCSSETGEHIKRMSRMVALLADKHPALTQEDSKILYHASPMHDIGKVVIPDAILHKPGKLTDEEFKIMKTHTTAAHEFLKSSKRKLIQAADIIAMQHHEKWNGTGYPNALKGEDIHIYGRIVAMIDVFDALTHKRSYKEAWSTQEAVVHIKGQKGTHFDPEIVDIFMEHVDEFVAIASA